MTSNAAQDNQSERTGSKSNAIQLRGRAWKYGDGVNTDVIFPGKYVYTLVDPSEWARHALEDLDPAFASAVKPGDIIVAGANWGCGSSREQAVVALKHAGISVIIAKSFARIYFRNCVNHGVLPVVCEAAADRIEHGETITVDIDANTIVCGAGAFDFPPLSATVLAIIAEGGLIPMLRKRFNAGHLPMAELAGRD